MVTSFLDRRDYAPPSTVRDVRRLVFRIPTEGKEDLLDQVLPLLPAGVREEEADGWVSLSSVAGTLPERSVLEAAAGRVLDGWAVEDVPADWRVRRALTGGG